MKTRLTFLLVTLLLWQQTLGQSCPEIQTYPQLNQLVNSGPQKGDWQAEGLNLLNYTWNFCTPQSTGYCSTPETVVCQTTTSGYPPYSCGVLGTQTIIPLANGLTFLYSHGDPARACEQPRQTNITVLCDPSGAPTSIIQPPVELKPTPPFAASCRYSILMSSPYACPRAPAIIVK